MKRIFSIIGIAAGVVSIVFAFIVKGQDYSSYQSSITYGGDAYTGIQNAAAATANNVGNLIDLVAWGFFAILFVFGLACIVFFGFKLLDALENESADFVKDKMPSIFKPRLDIANKPVNFNDAEEEDAQNQPPNNTIVN